MEKKEREKLEKRLIKTMESKLDTYPLAIENSVYEVLEVIMPTIEVELDKAREEGKGGVLEIFTEEELRVLRFALKVNREGIHTIWDEDTFDTIWKKVGGLPKLKDNK